MTRNYEDYFIKDMMDKYSDMVYRLCIVYLKNKSDADDAFQEIFIKIIEKSPIFMNNNHEKAWVITVTTNHCKNTLRKRKRENAIAFDENYILNNDKEVEDILPIILNLPLEYRKVIYLYYYEGYSTKEISGILKRRDATIRTWLKRGRDTLKIKIGGDLDE